ncbi:MAG: hypothetical protein IPL89_16135 [Acidobacteria bacterium]|nr:hypothetical protein [Acidobacteriota bacterium]
MRIRMMGGTLPTHAIVGPLKAPFVQVPVVNADNNQHAYDENLRMGHYLERHALDGSAPHGALPGVRERIRLMQTPRRLPLMLALCLAAPALAQGPA